MTDSDRARNRPASRVAATFPHHAEAHAVVVAPPELVFEFMDDPQRLASHMSRSSWRMGGSQMRTELDDRRGQAVGAHIRMAGRILGMRLSVIEAVVERTPHSRKVWETVGCVRLMVMGSYRMGFDLARTRDGSLLRVVIDYAWPSTRWGRWWGRILAAYYARWRARSVAEGAARHFASVEA